MDVNIDALAGQIGRQHEKICRALMHIVQHPKAGYTITGCRNDYKVLIGMLAAYQIVTSGHAAATVHSDAMRGAKQLGCDIMALRDRIEAAAEKKRRKK